LGVNHEDLESNRTCRRAGAFGWPDRGHAAAGIQHDDDKDEYEEQQAASAASPPSQAPPQSLARAAPLQSRI
jgi:hypothetical protein